MRHVGFGDRYSGSAAAILLQDAIEIVMVALLSETDAPFNGKMTFDQLIGALITQGIDVRNVVALKALNAQRINVKHYGQLAEPLSVQNYAEACEETIDSLVQQVIGLDLRQVVLTERLDDNSAGKTFLVEAEAQLNGGNYLQALVEIRKAIFVCIEVDYCVHAWGQPTTDQGIFAALLRGGRKAPYWAQSAPWIALNVNTPFDYVQIDHERLRLDCIEWGFSPADLHNLRRLTPAVFRASAEDDWKVQYESQYWGLSPSANASYCLDRAIDILVKQQQHSKMHRTHLPDGPIHLQSHYLNAPIFAKARLDSEVRGHVVATENFTISNVGNGFLDDQRFLHISGVSSFFPGGPLSYMSGYVLERPI